MKKARLFILWLLLAAINVFAKEGGGVFKINGHISGLRTGTIFLRYVTNGNLVLDSSKIADGHFEFAGDITVPGPANIRLDKQNLIDANTVKVFLEPANADVELSSKPFVAIKVEGLKTNEAITEWRGQLKDLKNRFANALNRLEIEKEESKRRVLEDSVVLYNIQKDAITFDFVKKHPQSYAVPYILSGLCQIFSASELKTVYNNLGSDVAATVYGKRLLENINKMNATTPGDVAADISGGDYIDNKWFSLKAQRGNYVLVDFWGSWCAPCIKLIPSLVEQYGKYKGKNLVFVSVCKDYNANMDKCKRIATGLGMNWVNLWDSEDKADPNSITSLYNVGVYPTTILIGPDGEILERGDGDYGYLKCKARLEQVFK